MNLPKDVETILEEYIKLLDEHFPSTLEEFYIHGSIAIGAYEKNSSDIDFLAVMNRRLTEEDTESLNYIHKILAQNYRRPELDGVYISWEELSKNNSKSIDSNGKYPFYNDGEIHFGNYFNFNPVTWWTLKNNGIKLISRDPKEFDFEVSAEELLLYVHDNMNSYWLSYIQQIEKNKPHLLNFMSEEIDQEIEWIVLGLLRQFYTMKEQNIVSKLGAGNYGLSHLPSRWHNIIQEAINIRKGENDRMFSSDMERVENTIHFSQYLIEHCNSFVGIN
ncbi:aminoglycoside adenylyltransferase domain-containing protein [Paucisalibacillus sp. EB02]|uniref:aminoglycoside adenylyltransferase domain-containing protein n=1 Tax=Paucisalibacillus sp. EB02 TaxID=1347087 RepID=UPI0004B60168|nr:aminoglycoside adenylyltransferase domain-containing protein [Paucisalibacillus sp. EB02]